MGAVGVRVREAHPRDALELLDLRRQVVAEGSWFIGTSDEAAHTVEDVESRIADARGSTTQTVRIARLDGVLVGYIELRPGPWRRTRHAVKLEIAVRDGHRGLGIGRALLQDALDWATASPDVHKVGLAVFADNERAIRLYRALGFEDEGRRIREYRMEDGSWRDDLLLYRFTS